MKVGGCTRRRNGGGDSRPEFRQRVFTAGGEPTSTILKSSGSTIRGHDSPIRDQRGQLNGGPVHPPNIRDGAQPKGSEWVRHIGIVHSSPTREGAGTRSSNLLQRLRAQPSRSQNRWKICRRCRQWCEYRRFGVQRLERRTFCRYGRGWIARLTPNWASDALIVDNLCHQGPHPRCR